MRAAAVDDDGFLLDRQVRPTPRDAPAPDALLDLMRRVLDHNAAGVAVVGVPGRVIYDSGRLEMAPNLPEGWLEHLTEEEPSASVGLPVSLANDADLAAVGEASFGAGRPYSDVVYMTISTGVGAGVVTGGRVVRGRRSLAELGHTVIDVNAAARGEPSTLEQLGSGTALARLAEEAGLPGDGREVIGRATAGDPVAGAVWERVMDAAAFGAVNAAQAFSPDVIVVGGGVALSSDELLGRMRARLASHGPAGVSVEVLRATLGDDAALAGAAGWRIAFSAEAVTDG